MPDWLWNLCNSDFLAVVEVVKSLDNLCAVNSSLANFREGSYSHRHGVAPVKLQICTHKEPSPVKAMSAVYCYLFIGVLNGESIDLFGEIVHLSSFWNLAMSGHLRLDVVYIHVIQLLFVVVSVSVCQINH